MLREWVKERSSLAEVSSSSSRFHMNNRLVRDHQNSISVKAKKGAKVYVIQTH